MTNPPWIKRNKNKNEKTSVSVYCRSAGFLFTFFFVRSLRFPCLFILTCCLFNLRRRQLFLLLLLLLFSSPYVMHPNVFKRIYLRDRFLSSLSVCVLGSFSQEKSIFHYRYYPVENITIRDKNTFIAIILFFCSR